MLDQVIENLKILDMYIKCLFIQSVTYLIHVTTVYLNAI